MSADTSGMQLNLSMVVVWRQWWWRWLGIFVILVSYRACSVLMEPLLQCLLDWRHIMCQSGMPMEIVRVEGLVDGEWVCSLRTGWKTMTMMPSGAISFLKALWLSLKLTCFSCKPNPAIGMGHDDILYVMTSGCVALEFHLYNICFSWDWWWSFDLWGHLRQSLIEDAI
jgi:hypothetical protein